MNFVLTGVSHNQAPLQILERVAVPVEDLPNRILGLSERLQSDGAATILSTCNRTELYAVANDTGAAIEEMSAHLYGLGTRGNAAGLADFRSELAPYIYAKTGYRAVHHLFRVVTGLDSLVQGDHQVAGQVSRSFQALATVGQPTDTRLSRMFHVAFRAGRKARKDSGLGWSQVSIPSFGVKLMEQKVGDLSGKSALLVGAGETGRLTAMALMRSGIGEMRIASRSKERALGLAEDMNAVAVSFGDVAREMSHVDIVMTCTGSDRNIILKTDVASAIADRPTDLHILDLGLPRDVDPGVGELDKVHLFTLEDLEQLQAEHQRSIANASEKAEAIVAEAAADFMDDIEIQPLLKDIGESAEQIRAAELRRTLAKLGPVNDETRDAIDAMT
ncbi:MAG: glutamyl-tRNA reductase, partial [Chloroflexi bacterium]|nr:glutamyl-tRNA reductase [Chloroflexota bacterium]